MQQSTREVSILSEKYERLNCRSQLPIAQGKAMADALQAAYQARKSNAGNAQSATQRRDEVLRALDRWVSDFKK